MRSMNTYNSNAHTINTSLNRELSGSYTRSKCSANGVDVLENRCCIEPLPQGKYRAFPDHLKMAESTTLNAATSPQLVEERLTEDERV